MTKRFIGIVVAAVMLLGIFALASCEVGLNSYKESARAEIQSYADAKMEEHTYSAEGLAAIAQAVTDGKAEIEGAQDKLAVTAAINKAKKEIHMVNYEGRDFLLTISVENTTIKKGEDFKVDVELKNQSGSDLEIFATWFFLPNIPNWSLFKSDVEYDPPLFTSLFENDSIISNIGFWGNEVDYWEFGNDLKKGTHELRFVAKFGFTSTQGNWQSVEVFSNAIILTVI
ncbi:MAG: hypothetical protein FWH03_03310 [Firmicutes bacterium]|nr:hypothetical protein [Bacillota bacterium]